MRIFYSLCENMRFDNPVVTVGSFDGVHSGHRVLLGRLLEIASRRGGESVVITFAPHPREVLSGGERIKLLNTLREKVYLLRNAGVENLIVIPFTKEFAATPYEDFVKSILVGKVGVSHLILGYDHRFGYGKEGGLDVLREKERDLEFSIEEIPCHNDSGCGVSSTEVRKAILAGDMKRAGELLGQGYIIISEATEGKILTVDAGAKLLPPAGAYRVTVGRTETPYDTYGDILRIDHNGNVRLDNPEAGNLGKEIIITFK